MNQNLPHLVRWLSTVLVALVWLADRASSLLRKSLA